MSEMERKTINIPEISRVEGHCAVHVDIKDKNVVNVTLDVFEGTRFFEKIVLGHKFSELPHITSRVCAICSTGHVLAAAYAIERIYKYNPGRATRILRELMHLGMIIESHATHIYALALPDYLGVGDLLQFASSHQKEFSTWNTLRNLGGTIQTVIGGRPFHPVSLQIGGLSHYPSVGQLQELNSLLQEAKDLAIDTCQLLLKFKPAVARTSKPIFMALIPDDGVYGYFGDTIKCSEGWQRSIDDYRLYLNEVPVKGSHAKRSTFEGKPVMVGSMARLFLFSDHLVDTSRSIYEITALAHGDTNSLWNNLAQAIEIVEAVERSQKLIKELCDEPALLLEGIVPDGSLRCLPAQAGKSVGAVECPRGTLYHYYEIDNTGTVLAADMITPSAQNSHRIEVDIKEVVAQCDDIAKPDLQKQLETLVRAYDPCNTCATHMVSVKVK
jgi:sulfhydrogenase subunit alpha